MGPLPLIAAKASICGSQQKIAYAENNCSSLSSLQIHQIKRILFDQAEICVNLCNLCAFIRTRIRAIRAECGEETHSASLSTHWYPLNPGYPWSTNPFFVLFVFFREFSELLLGPDGFSAHLRNFLQVLDLHIFRQKQPGHWAEVVCHFHLLLSMFFVESCNVQACKMLIYKAYSVLP